MNINSNKIEKNIRNFILEGLKDLAKINGNKDYNDIQRLQALIYMIRGNTVTLEQHIEHNRDLVEEDIDHIETIIAESETYIKKIKTILERRKLKMKT